MMWSAWLGQVDPGRLRGFKWGHLWCVRGTCGLCLVAPHTSSHTRGLKPPACCIRGVLNLLPVVYEGSQTSCLLYMALY